MGRAPRNGHAGDEPTSFVNGVRTPLDHHVLPGWNRCRLGLPQAVAALVAAAIAPVGIDEWPGDRVVRLLTGLRGLDHLATC